MKNQNHPRRAATACAHARNPLYVGNYLTILGLFVILNNPWAYLIGMAFYTLLYLAIVSAFR